MAYDLLEAKFREILQQHPSAELRRAALVVLGASVIRVFNRGTKEQLLKVLNSIEIKRLNGIHKQKTFQRWFEKQLTQLARVIKRYNRKNKKIYPGYKWGHAAKILILYLRHVVLHSRYFSDKDVEHLSPWLYVPIDGIVIKKLHDLNISLPFRLQQINEIDSAKKFFYIQKILVNAAAHARVPPIWFDDIWADRNKGPAT